MYFSGLAANKSAPVGKSSVSVPSVSGGSKKPVPEAIPEASNAEGPNLANRPGPPVAFAASKAAADRTSAGVLAR